MYSKENRGDRLKKLEQAMTYNYKGMQNSQSKSSLKEKVPRNYPLHFRDASDAVDILSKMETKSKERSQSRERLARVKLNRHKSNEAIITSSLKQQLTRRSTQSRSKSRERGNKSHQKFKISDFNSEVGKF